MKSVIRTLLLGVAVVVFAACTSEDEPWDASLIDNPPTDIAPMCPLWEIEPRYVVLGGEQVLLASVEQALRAEAARPAEAPLEIQVTKAGTVRAAIGKNALTMDALTVSGPINSDDLTYIRRCSTSGRLRHLNLKNARIEGDAMPEHMFLSTEYVTKEEGYYTVADPSYVPLYTIELPSTLKYLREYSLCNLLITHIELPSTLESMDDMCLARTPFLGGEITLEENLSVGSGVFNKAGDGTLVINCRIKTVPCAFSDARLKAINLEEGLVEELAVYALFSVKGIESITLPASLKRLGIGSLQDIPQLKTLYVKFSDPSLASITWEDVMDGATMTPFGDLFERGDSPTPSTVEVYVPAGCRDAFVNQGYVAWEWFRQIYEMEY